MVHSVIQGHSFTPHCVLRLRTYILHTTARKICLMIGKDSPGDMQSKVMEQKLSVLERYCGSRHVCLVSTLSALAGTEDDSR